MFIFQFPLIISTLVKKVKKVLTENSTVKKLEVIMDWAGSRLKKLSVGRIESKILCPKPAIPDQNERAFWVNIGSGSKID